MYSPYQQNYPMNYNQSDFIPVPNEAYARNYPVQPGHSVTLKDESQPYVYYSKTMGSSQFDTPIFKRYRLVEETAEQPELETADNSVIESLNAKIEALENEIEGIKKKLSARRKKEVEDDTE